MLANYKKRTGFKTFNPKQQRHPQNYVPGELLRLTVEHHQKAAEQSSDQVARIYIGERGGRYYKRRRADGTTFREYTY